MGHSHQHGHDHGAAHDHARHGHHHHSHHHSHGADAPHPAQAVKWSLLQMSVIHRLGLVTVVSGAMWALVAGAMQ